MHTVGYDGEQLKDGSRFVGRGTAMEVGVDAYSASVHASNTREASNASAMTAFPTLLPYY